MMDTSEAPAALVMPCLPPGGLFEIVFSFDTTGSMSRVADEVKGRLQEMIQRLQADIAGIRIGLIAHGDYCDKEVFYLEKHIDLSNNIVELCNFLNDVEGTGGGDPEECYEYVLRMASEYSWTPGSQRALVVIGDATPHDADYELNTYNLDWRKEAENLAKLGIKIYGVQAFDEADSTEFFKELVEITSGHHVKLGEFSHVCDFIMAICYREKGEDFLMDYEAEVRAREGRKKIANDLEGLFGVLRRGDSSASNVSGPSTLRKAISGASAAGPSTLRKAISGASSTGPIDLSKSGSGPSTSMMNGEHSRSSSPDESRAIRPSRRNARITSGPSISGSRSRSRSGSSGSIIPISRLSSCSSSSSCQLAGLCSKVSNTKHLPIAVANVEMGRKHMTPKKTIGNSKIQDYTLRHKVPDTKFILKQNGLGKRWSHWKLAITNDIPKSEKVWMKRDKVDRKTGRKLSTGWRKRTLFAKDSGKTRVLYEVATQRKSGGKMHVMFSKWGLLGTDPENWEKRVLGKDRLRDLVEEVLSNDWKVFVRRFVAKGLGKNQRDSVRKFRRQYRYSWANENVTGIKHA